MGGPDFLWDRAFRFGMSVFESVAIHKGRALLFEEHLSRLVRASRELLAVDASPYCEAAQQLILPDRESGVLRVYVTAGAGSMIEDCNNPNGFALFETMEICSGPGQGLSLRTDRAPALPAPGGWKTGNYWANLRALQSARQEGFDEVVLMNSAGEVISCATGNLFCVIDGRLLTPSHSSGARRGVIREWVMALTGSEETLLSTEEVARADEIFVVNSRIGIAAVAVLDGRKLSSTAQAGQLAATYREKILRA